MNKIRLGSIISDTQERDAIHIAVAPVVAAERLAPGQHVGLIGDLVGPSKDPIGIVDPFLGGPVFKGDRFWLCLYPNSIVSLRHDWTHRAFENRAAVQNNSEAWLRAFAAKDADLPYGELLEGAKVFLESNEYLCDGGKWESFDLPDVFWDHYEAVTSTKVPKEKRGSFFSCSCN